MRPSARAAPPRSPPKKKKVKSSRPLSSRRRGRVKYRLLRLARSVMHQVSALHRVPLLLAVFVAPFLLLAGVARLAAVAPSPPRLADAAADAAAAIANASLPLPALALADYLPAGVVSSDTPVAAPRPTRQHTLDEFGTASAATSVGTNTAPIVSLILACDVRNPCCNAGTLAPALRAALAQSLRPSSVAIVHGCPAGGASEARLTTAAESEAVRISPAVPRFVSVHACAVVASAPGFDTCLLRFLAHPPPALARAIRDPDAFVLVATTATLLEPTSVESLVLYLYMRPALPAVLPLGYNFSTLHDALAAGDPLRANVSYPPLLASKPAGGGAARPPREQPLKTLPLLTRGGQIFAWGHDDSAAFARELWHALARLLSRARIMRVPLYTFVGGAGEAGALGTATLALREAHVAKQQRPPHLWSPLAFYKWSARQDARESYAVGLKTNAEKLAFDLYETPGRRVFVADANGQPVAPAPAPRPPRAILVMPWMQMGGSAKCTLDIAEAMVTRNWAVTFVFTNPFWHEDVLGELALNQEWIDKARAISSDVFDLVALAPNDKFSKTLRYLVETREPDFILTSSSRVLYEHAEFIKLVSPRTIMADYNHMVHMDWYVGPGKGGGMPRYGAEFTRSFDLHLTASDNVTTFMKGCIPTEMLAATPQKVQTCYIGADPSALYDGVERDTARERMRLKLGIADNATVVLFAGRYVWDKGMDVMADVVQRVSGEDALAKRLAFVFVGHGPMEDDVLSAVQAAEATELTVVKQPPAIGLMELREYYAMADILLLPSNNEGIALVLFEAMAAGVLVMSTDVGGQKELIRAETGILLPRKPSTELAEYIVNKLRDVTMFEPMFREIQKRGTAEVRERFTTEKFVGCVLDNLERVKSRANWTVTGPLTDEIERIKPHMAEVMSRERVHGIWRQKQVRRSLEGQVSIGIKTYVCDVSIVRQVLALVRSIRVNYPRVRVILANDGPTALSGNALIRDDVHTEEVMLPRDSGISIGRNHMVNMSTTEFFVLLDDDHVFDEDTDLDVGTRALAYFDFDIVGMRVRNLPGIDELERISIFIPRYVARISEFKDRLITLCVWNENNGPGVQSMKVPIRVDVLHNAMLAKTDVLRAHPWKNILKVNEHMTFFLAQRKAGVRVGYLPSVFVHHRARRYSACYRAVRFREDKYEQLLEYKDSYLWDVPCGDAFPETVKKYIELTKDWK